MQTEFKESLLKQRDEILQKISNIKKDKTREEGSLEADFAEQAVSLENKEVLDQLDESFRERFQQINAALERIDSGQFGKCLTCGEKISASRLEAIPYAITCVNCQES